MLPIVLTVTIIHTTLNASRRVGRNSTIVKATHRDSTSAAQHKTQGKRKADRWKIDCERRREEHKTLLVFPSPKTLNYYWLLLYYFNNVHMSSAYSGVR